MGCLVPALSVSAISVGLSVTDAWQIIVSTLEAFFCSLYNSSSMTWTAEVEVCCRHFPLCGIHGGHSQRDAVARIWVL